MLNSGASKSLCLHVEHAVVFKIDLDWHPARHQTFIEDAHLPQGIVYGVILVFHQLAATSGDIDRTPWDVEGIELDQRTPSTFVAPLDQKLIQLCLLLCAKQG